MSTTVEPRPASLWDDEGGTGPVGRLARRLSWSESQVYTAAIGLGVAVFMLALGVPPTLEDRPSRPVAAPRPSASGPADDDAGDEPAPTTTTTTTTTIERPRRPDARRSTPPPSDGDEARPPAPGAPPAPVPARTHLVARVGDPGAPEGVAVDDRGRVHVATNNSTLRGRRGPSQVLRYGPDGALQAAYAVEGQPDVREAGLLGLVFGDDGRLYALDGSTGRVLAVDVDRQRQQTVATLPDLRPCVLAPAPCEPGTSDGRPLPKAAVWADGGLLVADAGQGTIWRVEGDEAHVWHQSPALAPPARLAGMATGADGALVLSVDGMVTVDGSVGGAVFRLPVDGAGRAGQPTVLARLGPGEGPTGVAVGPSRRVYVALSGVHEVLVLTHDGDAVGRVGAEDVAAEAGVPLDTPVGLAFDGPLLLVTNQSALANDPAHWTVVGLATTEPARARA